MEIQNEHPAFLPAEPRKLLENGNFAKVPMMFGYTSDEGLLTQVFRNLEHKPEKIDYSKYIPNDLIVDTDTSKKIQRDMKQFYTKYQDSQVDDMQQEINLATDSWFWYGIYSSIRARVKTSQSPIYLYRFSADTRLNIFKRLNPITAKHPGKIAKF